MAEVRWSCYYVSNYLSLGNHRMHIFQTIASFLTAALSLLGLVQANPTLPPAIQDSATQTAQQLITTATNLIQTNTTPAAPAVSVGMSEYTDPNFGFTFWYPTSLTVKEVQNDLFGNGLVYGRPDTVAVKHLQIGDVNITELTSPSRAIRTYADHGR